MPGQVGPAAEVYEAAFETGRMIRPRYRLATRRKRKVVSNCALPGRGRRMHVEFALPSIYPNHVPESRTRGFI